MPGQYLTIEQVCELFQLTKYGILSARRRKIDPLPSFKIAGRVRFDEDEVRRWVSRQTTRERQSAKAGRRVLSFRGHGRSKKVR